jgi:hypothetical protein
LFCEHPESIIKIMSKDFKYASFILMKFNRVDVGGHENEVDRKALNKLSEPSYSGVLLLA